MKEMLQKIKDYFTPERRLFYSVVSGWGVILLCIGIPSAMMAVGLDSNGEALGLGIFIAALFLTIRYSTIGPVLKVTGAGLTTVGFVSILDMLFSRRDQQGGFAMGALIGTLIVIFLVLLWNAIKALYYLVRETYVLVTNYDLVKQQVFNKTAGEVQ